MIEPQAEYAKAPHSQKDTKQLWKRLGIVLGIVALLIAIGMIISYATRPKIQYTLKKADCSNSAIESQNKLTRGNTRACVLIVTAKNMQNRSVRLDYDGIGGGPGADHEPLIRIYSMNNTFCYALLAGENNTFSPNATNEFTLRCGSVQNPPKNYDVASDAHPTSITIVGGYTKKTLELN